MDSTKSSRYFSSSAKSPTFYTGAIGYNLDYLSIRNRGFYHLNQIFGILAHIYTVMLFLSFDNHAISDTSEVVILPVPYQATLYSSDTFLNVLKLGISARFSSFTISDRQVGS
ncbi:MAG: hypothetical protein RMX96_16240 [Nostoc sp. ChiSLP02]|nr:hypothetical protein [Nostoc sp. DedSLP05]MDZ8102174.1 hypothetical protein [Nostoc sp. DedSLP01]MDZ8186386.1 hypothetical protein [Nostoc sp. ChiSLP02]